MLFFPDINYYWSHQAITITLHFQTSSKDTLLPVSLSCHLASIHQRALILFIQTLALYKSFTYLLTYLLTYKAGVCVVSCPVDASCRSKMNISIRIGGSNGNEPLEKKFVTEAAHEGMIHLNGHR